LLTAIEKKQSMTPKKTVLLCVLNWGIGHAARCVKIIEELLQLNLQVVIASDGDALIFLQNKFPELLFERLPAYDVRYPKDESMVTAMAVQLPKLVKVIARERMTVKNLVRKHRIDYILSDNRYGCRHTTVKSIFITHQIHLQMPAEAKWMELIVNSVNHRLISKFSECWIPDVAARDNLSGKLSHPPLENCKFIGALSRFRPITLKSKKIKYLGIVSGPEPQRTIFENILLQSFLKSGEPSMIARGCFAGSKMEQSPNVAIKNFMNEEEIAEAVSMAEYVICRSGYSSIMDLASMKTDAKVIFVPTPGQTEQEYLAEKFEQENLCVKIPQHSFYLQEACQKAKRVTTFGQTNYMLESSTLLSQALTSLITS
jgi:uncharacterized protein (TIGR00661 family)